MLRLIPLAGALALIIGCATAPAPGPEPQAAGDAAVTTRQAPQRERATPLTPAELLMRDLRPRGGQPLFLGIGPRRRDREEEQAAAMLHAAEQASRYERLAAAYTYVSQRGTSALGYVDDIAADWSASRADALVETMEILAIEQDAEGTYVLATTAAVPPAPAIPPFALDREPPVWVQTPPRIPGYLVAVGVADRSRRMRDSADRADQDALRELLLQTGATLRIIADSREVEGVGTANQVTAAEAAEALLAQFYVVARYVTPDGNFYYSLALARED